jgi:hypothetical protein
MINASTLEIDKHPSLILLRAILQPHLATHLLHARFDLLHMIATVIPLAHNDMQMRLSAAPSSPDALLQHVLGFLDKQAVQIDGVAGDARLGVVGAEDVVAGLVVVLLHLGGVLLAFLAERVGGSAVAGLVGLVRAVEA